jgi:hypothetical protein
MSRLFAFCSPFAAKSTPLKTLSLTEAQQMSFMPPHRIEVHPMRIIEFGSAFQFEWLAMSLRLGCRVLIANVVVCWCVVMVGARID